MVRPRKHTDEELLSAAKAIIIERGPSISMATIAEHVGLSQPALSKRFGGRQSLMLAALMPRFDGGIITTLREGPGDAPFREQLFELGLEAMAMLREFVPVLLTLRSAGLMPSSTKATAPLPHEWFDALLAGFFQRAMDRGMMRSMDATVASTVLIGSLQARAMHDYVTQKTQADEPHSADTDEAAVRSLVDAIWSGFQP